jgi:hypothetical protein
MPLQTPITASQVPLPPPLFSVPGQSFLECVQALAGELDLAMNAIAGDELRTFEDSVSRQQVLASRLKTMALAQATSTQPATALPQDESATLDGRIDAALGNLHTLNRRYAALLKQSSETVKMLLHLLQASSGYMRGGDAAPANYSTWSCQL